MVSFSLRFDNFLTSYRVSLRDKPNTVEYSERPTITVAFEPIPGVSCQCQTDMQGPDAADLLRPQGSQNTLRQRIDRFPARGAWLPEADILGRSGLIVSHAKQYCQHC